MAVPVDTTFVVLLGFLVGSFINVCIHRIPLKASVLRPRSYCPLCEESIKWHDNIPIVGYLLLGGRCRHCRQAISWIYPAVELLTALLFLLVYQRGEPDQLSMVRLFFLSALIVLFFVDLRHQILPNVITIPCTCVGLISACFYPPGLVNSMLGMSVGAGSLLVISQLYYLVRGEDGVGSGDVKLLAMIGGFLGWPSVMVVLFVASIFGSIVGIGLMMFFDANGRSALPFGSFLAFASIVFTLVDGSILAWYSAFY